MENFNGLSYKGLVDGNESDNALFEIGLSKTFDKVEHVYLWEAMEKLGLGEGFIKLLKGLVKGASYRIHMNGGFLEEIALTRGILRDALYQLCYSPW